jgi:hypothetical protein
LRALAAEDCLVEVWACLWFSTPSGKEPSLSGLHLQPEFGTLTTSRSLPAPHHGWTTYFSVTTWNQAWRE